MPSKRQWSLGLPHPSLWGRDLGLPVSLTDKVPFGVVTECQDLKLQGKCPTTGINTAAESKHLAGHLISTGYLQAGWQLGRHSSLLGAEIQKDRSFPSKGQNQYRLYLCKRFTWVYTSTMYLYLRINDVFHSSLCAKYTKKSTIRWIQILPKAIQGCVKNVWERCIYVRCS